MGALVVRVVVSPHDVSDVVVAKGRDLAATGKAGTEADLVPERLAGRPLQMVGASVIVDEPHLLRVPSPIWGRSVLIHPTPCSVSTILRSR